jgi:hypothetical protein
VLAGCAAPLALDGPAYAELPAPIPEWIAVRATDTDDGRRFELARGASIAIALRAPAAAGLGWLVARTPPMLRQTGRFSGPVWPPEAPASRTSPAPLWQVFVFEAREPGEDTLLLELRGGGGDRPDRFAIRLSVTPG